MSDPIDEFVHLFNLREEASVVGLLADDVTAEVVDSGFGTENGPAEVRAKSLDHMITMEPHPLLARRETVAGEEWVVFVTDEQPEPRVDTLAKMETRGLTISRIRYYVIPFNRPIISEVAAALGLEVADT